MTWEDIKLLVLISDDLIEEKGKDALIALGEQYYYEEILHRYNGKKGITNE